MPMVHRSFAALSFQSVEVEVQVHEGWTLNTSHIAVRSWLRISVFSVCLLSYHNVKMASLEMW